MEANRSYIKEKRNKKDKCNICGELTNLTWDHVPPKFCFNNEKVKYNSLFEISGDYSYEHISQNGIRYRSICARCNNDLLGSNYDKEFEKVVNILYRIYTTPGEIAQYIIIPKVNVNKISRAIVGHLLAARNEYVNRKNENELREFFLNPNLMPPKDFNLFYYTYIYNTIMIIRDVLPKKIFKTEYAVPEGIVSCLNTFPLAFILVKDCSNEVELYDMFKLCSNNINDVVDLKIDLLSYMYPNKKRKRHPYWPCWVSDDDTGTSMILTGEDNSSVFSNIRYLKMK